MNALDALHRARRAWENSQPQTFMDFDGLDEPQPSALRFVEPAALPPTRPGGGLTTGVEPCRDTTTGLMALRVHRPEDSPVTALAARMAGSAPSHNTTGPGALPAEEKRPAQRRSL